MLEMFGVYAGIIFVLVLGITFDVGRLGSTCLNIAMLLFFVFALLTGMLRSNSMCVRACISLFSMRTRTYRLFF